MKTLRDITLREVPVVEPSASLAEVIELLEAEPLETVVLVGDEQYMGVFNKEALESSLIPEGEDRSLLQVGPYVHPVRVIGSPDMPVSVALSQMVRRGQDVLPVVDNRTYRGVIIRADLENS